MSLAASRITPFLWFNDNAAEAADFYVSIFPNSRRLDQLRNPDPEPAGVVPPGKLLTVRFELDGQPFVALNGGPAHRFNEAVSFVVSCQDQAEIDFYWSRLTADGGRENACGWLYDRFGLCWQIVPANLAELLRTPQQMKAMLGMKKLDVATLQRAGEA